MKVPVATATSARGRANFPASHRRHLSGVTHLGAANQLLTEPAGPYVVDAQLHGDQMMIGRRQRPAATSERRIEQRGDQSAMCDAHRPQVRLVHGHFKRRASLFDGDRVDLQPFKKCGAASIGFESLATSANLGSEMSKLAPVLSRSHNRETRLCNHSHKVAILSDGASNGTRHSRAG